MNRLAHTKIKSSVRLVTLVMSDSATLWTIARQAALSIGFSREEEWMLWTVVLEKTLESPLDCKEIQPVHPKDQSWMFIGRTDAEAETPVLWLPHVKSWLIGKDSDAGRDWGQEEKGTTEDETARWHHRLDRHESEWTPGVGDRQGGLACCDSWGRKELDTTEWLNWTELILEWVAMPSSRGSSWPGDWTCISCIAGGFFITELPGKPMVLYIKKQNIFNLLVIISQRWQRLTTLNI